MGKDEIDQVINFFEITLLAAQYMNDSPSPFGLSRRILNFFKPDPDYE